MRVRLTADLSPPFALAPCLEAQEAAQWNFLTAPVANGNDVQRNYGQPSNDGPTLAFTATGPEVNVFAPGVLDNDTVNFSISGGATVPDWNEGHLSKVTAEFDNFPAVRQGVPPECRR